MTESNDAQLAHERRKGEEWGAYKTKLDDMERELRGINITLNTLRDTFDKLYAIKLVEKIVFALVSLIGLGVAGALLKLVMKGN